MKSGFTAHWASFIKGTIQCPRCETEMKQQYKAYVVLTDSKRGSEQFVCGSRAGHFCEGCRTLFLNCADMEEVVGMNFAGKFRYTVVGIVDREAIPPERRDQELGTDTNPIPIETFRNELPFRKSRAIRRRP